MTTLLLFVVLLVSLDLIEARRQVFLVEAALRRREGRR
jgi:hypothetical protein